MVPLGLVRIVSVEAATAGARISMRLVLIDNIVERNLLLALPLEFSKCLVVPVGLTRLWVVANLRHILDRNSLVLLLDVLLCTSPELLDLGVVDVTKMTPARFSIASRVWL